MDLSKLKNRKPSPDGKYVLYSVLLPVMAIEGNNHLIFEVRAHNLRTQPGEICFPGGRVEPGEDPLETSIRETCEELNINRSNIEVLCPLDYIVTPFNFIIYPYLGIIKDVQIDNIKWNTQEVDHIFTVPLDYLSNHQPIVHTVDLHVTTKDDYPHYMVDKGKDYKWKTGTYPVYFYTYGDYIIWGLTGRMTAHLLSLLNF